MPNNHYDHKLTKKEISLADVAVIHVDRAD